jgi:hypothetical protein
MIRHKWIVGLRNKLSSLAMECDSYAVIEDCQLTPKERETIQYKISEVITYIDNQLKL